MKIEIVVGTRPEIIKMAPIVKECLNMRDVQLRMSHTGQHYDTNLSACFFAELKLPSPDVNIGIGSDLHGAQTAKALLHLEEDFLAWKPDIVIAEGDTNAVLSAALASIKLGIPFGHVEAGIRSFDRSMPEEVNRILVDQCSDLCFAPTETARDNLLREGVRPEIIYVTGNTIADAVIQHVNLALKESNILQKLNLSGKYIVATIHRPNNTDNVGRLREVVAGINGIGAPVAFPIHPRTAERLKANNLRFNTNVIGTKPLGYLDFLNLLANAYLVITDSGGIQEEASILDIPCLTVRDNTERPETIDAGVNMLVPANANQIVNAVGEILRSRVKWQQMRDKKRLYGDGNSAKRIMEIVLDKYGGKREK
jgi:UDP-N-acetylglucosamine 2-epimerase (non-hydrolysing)